jgi:betaine/carnitine transporter, BCCT family
MFQMLENLPISSITSFLAIVLVLVFFITSSDSGLLVIDSITAGGKIDAPTSQRIFWAIMEGVIAAALLFGGGGGLASGGYHGGATVYAGPDRDVCQPLSGAQPRTQIPGGREKQFGSGR